MNIRPTTRPLAASLLLVALTACTADQTEHAGVTIQRSDCVECHSGDVRAALFDHASVDFGSLCATCHVETTWEPTRVPAHDAFALDGAHRAAACGACHAADRADPQPTACLGCHAADRDGAEPTHAGFPDDCSACHGTTAWRPATGVDHDDFFPLTGAHRTVDCARCHIDDVFAGTPRTCVGCHAADREGATPPHARFPDTCDDCHDTVGWRPAELPDHDLFYPLRGAHTEILCRACHVDDVYPGTPRTCVGCHAADRDGATPTHAGFPDACTGCHTETAWRPTNFAGHDQWYPIEGAHQQVDCARCHVNEVYAGTPRTCVGCHAAARDAAAPPHGGFPDQCTDCHDQQAWRPTHFAGHDQWYPIEGAHQQVDCARCHVNEVYAGTPRTCVGCHAADRAAATPTHAGFQDDCTGCHTQQAWRPSTFAGHDQWYPIEGAHQPLDCGRCHVNDVFAGTPRTCVGCHADDRVGVEPPHGAFPDACTGCHNQRAWRPADFAGHDQWYPIEGAHVPLDCGRCHVGDVYAGTPRTCVGCHAADRDGADPPHAGYPDQCTVCHTQQAWRPADFSRHDDIFPLVGAHQQVDCARCHVDDVYTGTPRTCIGCHRPDFEGAVPTHVRYAPECLQCHTQVAWEPAHYAHVFRVPHEGVRACGDCHTHPEDFGLLGCTTCHEHRRAEADAEHREVRNYQYLDAECVRCHPRGDD